MNAENPWMTVKEVAAYLKVSTDVVYRLAQHRQIPASRVGNRWRFHREKIDAWMLAQSEKEYLQAEPNQMVLR